MAKNRITFALLMLAMATSWSSSSTEAKPSPAALSERVAPSNAPSDAATPIHTPSPQVDERYNIKTAIPRDVLIQDFGFATSYISMIATVLGVVLTIITIGFAFTTYLGFREISQIKDLEIRFKSMIEETEKNILNQRDSINQLAASKSALELAISSIREEINSKSHSLILASHYFSRGEDDYSKGKFEDAVTNFTFALDNDPENPDILYRLGRSYVNLDRTDAARNCFQRSMIARPDWFRPHMGMATIFRFTEPHTALKHAKSGIELQCDDHEALDYAGLICRDIGDIPESIDYHLKSLSIADDTNTNFFLAILFFSIGDVARAKSNIFSAISKIDGDNPPTSIRPVWRELIRWLEAVISGSKVRSRGAWAAVLPFLDNKRVRSAVLSHVSYVMKSKNLRQNDWLGFTYAELS